MSSFVLQPFTPPSRQHPLYPGTFVAKFNALATSSCVRVLQIDAYFYDITRAAAPVVRTNVAAIAVGAVISDSEAADDAAPWRSFTDPVASIDPGRISRLRPQPASTGSNGNTHLHQLEEIIKNALRKLVFEIESAFKDKLRLLNSEFQVTSTNRLVLVRVSHIVFFSDLKKRDEGTAASHAANASKQAKKTQRPAVSAL